MRSERFRRSGGADGHLVQFGVLTCEGAKRPLHPNHVDVEQTRLNEFGSELARVMVVRALFESVPLRVVTFLEQPQQVLPDFYGVPPRLRSLSHSL